MHWIDTDIAGRIVDWSADAPAFLAIAARTLAGRALPYMFLTGRPQEGDLVEVTRTRRFLEREAVFRPKERRGVHVWLRIERQDRSDEDQRPILRWTIVVG
jgi:hypothetical protein